MQTPVELGHPRAMTIEVDDDVWLGATPCVRLRNCDVELLVPKTYGVRVIHYGRRGGTNVFAEVDPLSQRVQTRLGKIGTSTVDIGYGRLLKTAFVRTIPTMRLCWL